MAQPSLSDRTTTTEYLAAVVAALSAICWQHEHTGTPDAQLVHEHRGPVETAPKYRVTDLDTDPGSDWRPVALVTTTGTVISPSRTSQEDPEVAEMFAGFAQGLRRAEAVTE